MELHYVKIDKDWNDLAKGDSVTFVLPKKSVLYSIYEYSTGNCLLTGRDCSNDKIFSILGVEGCDFVRNIVGYSCSGAFPEVRSLEDLKKVIKALDDECVKKFGIPDNVSSESKDKYLHPTELKDGDFIKIWNDWARFIYIFKKYENNNIYRYASFDLNYNDADTNSHIKWGEFKESTKITYATEEEKNLLNEALFKKGYIWNNSTKKLDTIQNLISSDNVKYNISLDFVEDNMNKEELNLFPTKKHYQLNFNY